MNILRLVILFSNTFLLNACLTTTAYQKPPQIKIKEQWTLHNIAIENTQSLEKWWQNFKDPELNRLIEEGLVNNHDIRRAALKLEEAKAVLAASRSDLWPSVDLEGKSTRNRYADSNNSSKQRFQTRNYSGVAITWELDLFGRIRQNVAADKARYEQLQYDAKAVALSITAEIVRSYFGLRIAQEELSVQQNIIKSLEATRNVVVRRVQTGDLAKVETQTVNAKLLAAKAVLPDIEARVRTYALTLSILTGGQPDKELYLASTISQGLSLPAIPVGKPADIIRRRPDIYSAERNLAASSADLNYAVAEQFPKLTINGTGGFDALSSNQLFHAVNKSWSIFPFISWRILDGKKVRAEIHAAEARQKMAALQYEKTVLTALNEAETTMGNYYYYLQIVDHSQKVANSAQKLLQSQLRRFNEGDADMTDVLEAQRQFAEAQYSLVVAQGNASSVMVDVVKALGGGI